MQLSYASPEGIAKLWQKALPSCGRRHCQAVAEGIAKLWQKALPSCGRRHCQAVADAG
jgi:hypothetical protein